MRRVTLDDPRYYLNRHVQWLDFNRRVLEEARDPGNPLLERVKFLAITANNLDEFVEVRVSSFLQRIEHGSTERSPTASRQRKNSRWSRGRCTLWFATSTSA
jgi:polyphosphate kinase